MMTVSCHHLSFKTAHGAPCKAHGLFRNYASYLLTRLRDDAGCHKCFFRLAIDHNAVHQNNELHDHVIKSHLIIA